MTPGYFFGGGGNVSQEQEITVTGPVLDMYFNQLKLSTYSF